MDAHSASLPTIALAVFGIGANGALEPALRPRLWWGDGKRWGVQWGFRFMRPFGATLIPIVAPYDDRMRSMQLAK